MYTCVAANLADDSSESHALPGCAGPGRRDCIFCTGELMLQIMRQRFGTIVFAIALAAASAWGEKRADVPPTDAAVPANVSARLYAARTVFISGTLQAPVSRLGPSEDLEYADFQVTSTIAGWRLYRLVSSETPELAMSR